MGDTQEMLEERGQTRGGDQPPRWPLLITNTCYSHPFVLPSQTGSRLVWWSIAYGRHGGISFLRWIQKPKNKQSFCQVFSLIWITSFGEASCIMRSCMERHHKGYEVKARGLSEPVKSQISTDPAGGLTRDSDPITQLSYSQIPTLQTM